VGTSSKDKRDGGEERGLKEITARDFLLVSLFSLLLFSAFPPLNLGILAWVSFLPLFLALENKVPRDCFLLAFYGGILFFSLHIWWLAYVTRLGVSILILYLSLYFGVFGLMVGIARKRLPYFFFAPSLWIILEFLRAYLFTGFPWSPVGNSQAFYPLLIQTASLTGVYGISFLVLAGNCLIMDLFTSPLKNKLKVLLIFSLLFTLVLFYGEIRLQNIESSPALGVGLVQGNIAPDIKANKERIRDIFLKYAQLSKNLSSSHFLVWPETALPEYIEENQEISSELLLLSQELNLPLLTGALSREEGKNYNSVFLIDPHKGIKEIYRKVKLVPFGEYLPLKRFFPFLTRIAQGVGNFSPGLQYRTAQICHHNFAVIICFEDLFPRVVRRFAEKNIEFLIVITNDACFGESPAAWQHMLHSMLRAVEIGKPIIRVANTGVTGVIDSRGRISYLLSRKGRTTWVEGTLKGIIYPSKETTFYVRWGNWFVILNMVYLLLSLKKAGILIRFRHESLGKKIHQKT